MHADRRYRYVRLRCTVDRARMTKWKTSRDTFNYLVEQHAPNGPVSVRRPKIDGGYSITHATPCTRQPLALLSDKFGTTDVLFTVHGKAHTSLNTERRPRPRHLLQMSRLRFLSTFPPGTDSAIPHILSPVFSASKGAGANTDGAV
jgi:hypothetical protein